MRFIFALLLALSCRAQILTPVFYGVTAIVGTPTDSPGQGTYGSTQTVTLSDPTANFIRYTTNGTTPSYTSGTLYTTGFSVAVTTTVKAIGCSLVNDTCGGVLTSVYTISTLTFIENVHSSGATASTYVATVTSTAAGDTLTCVSFYRATETFSSLSDNKSQSYAAVQAPTTFNGGSGIYRVDQVVNSASAVTTITMTFTGNGHGALLCNHSSGIAASPVDQNVFNFTATGSSTWTSGNTSTLAQAVELGFGFGYGLCDPCTYSATGAWGNLTHITNPGDGVDMVLETQITAATTAIAATGTISPTGNNVYAGVVTLK